MSWALESDNQSELNLTVEQQWKISISKLEEIFKNIKKIHDDIKAKFDYIERNQVNMNEIESKRQKLNPLITEMTNYIAQLDRLILSAERTSATNMNFQLKEIKRRAADITLSVKKICASINVELDKRQFTRKKELSVISNEMGGQYNEGFFDGAVQTSTYEDPELKTAIEEQKQSEKIAKDMLILEKIFIDFSTMIHEQGETVVRIEGNTEVAYKNIESGEKELVKAVDYKRSALKKKICIIGIVIACLAVIALIIGLSVGLKK